MSPGLRFGRSVILATSMVALMLVAGPLRRADADNTSTGSETVSATTTSGPPANAKSTAGLRAAAVSWARAFLTGSRAQIRRLQAPECKSSTRSTLPRSAAALYLRGLREMMRRQLGVPLDKVRISGVELRGATARRGEAQVLYDLPTSKVGNDNWVEFTLHEGRWKVSNCKAPILGRSTSATGSDAPPVDTNPSTSSVP